MTFKDKLVAKIEAARAEREASRPRDAEAPGTGKFGLGPYLGALSAAALEVKNTEQGAFLFGKLPNAVARDRPGVFVVSSVDPAWANGEHCLFEVEGKRLPEQPGHIELKTTFYVNVVVDFEPDTSLGTYGPRIYMDREPIIQTVSSPEEAVEALYEAASTFLARNEPWVTQMIEEDNLANGVAGDYRR